jgi:hypothetical protein
MQKKLSPKLNWAERVSYLMDEKFRIRERISDLESTPF